MMQQEIDPQEDPYEFFRQLTVKEQHKKKERLAKQSPLRKFVRWTLSFIWY